MRDYDSNKKRQSTQRRRANKLKKNQATAHMQIVLVISSLRIRIRCLVLPLLAYTLSHFHFGSLGVLLSLCHPIVPEAAETLVVEKLTLKLEGFIRR